LLAGGDLLACVYKYLLPSFYESLEVEAGHGECPSFKLAIIKVYADMRKRSGPGNAEQRIE
jgi:hypothetical protein